MFLLYIERCQLDSVYAIAWVGDRPADVRASMADSLCHDVGGGDWVAVGNLTDSKAGVGEAGDRVRQCGADDSQPGSVWVAVAGSLARGERGSAGDSCADGLRSAAYSAEHLCRHWTVSY